MTTKQPGTCIPPKLVAVCRPEHEEPRSFTEETVLCRSTWVTNADPKMVERAKTWARGGTWDNRKTYGEPDTFEIDNEPMGTLYLVHVEHRNEGGLAYKVVTPQGWLVDLRETEFLEAIFQGRMSPEGYITGEYVWSVSNGNMRIVRVGSQMYKDRLEAGERAKLKKIAVKDLVVGNGYRGRDKSENPHVFLGRARIKGSGDKTWYLVWQWFYSSHQGPSEYAHLTKSHSYVEDMGPTPFDKSRIRYYEKGQSYPTTKVAPADLEWK